MIKPIQIFKYIQLAGVVLLMAACSGEGNKEGNNHPDKNNTYVVPAKIKNPLTEEQYTVGENIEVEIVVDRPDAVKNLRLMVEDTLFADQLEVKNQTVTIPTLNGGVGWVNLQLLYTDDKGKDRADNRMVIVFSDVKPGSKTAEIVTTYAHEKTSYTQGLEFYKGDLYEGTGQYGQSILAQVDLKSGTKIRQKALSSSVFGEGISIMNDTIYQLTYRSGICYVYDMEFNLLTQFNYQNQGWGLCNNGKSLIMSNGSHEIVWRNPKTFEITKTLEVLDDQETIQNLNELELINGDLYANIYTKNKIAQIDTTTGKVLNYIDCNILVGDAAEPGNDVLNGIAYNPETKKVYMTGKWWGKLYEVSFE